MTIIAVAAQAFNLYCEDSDNPAFAHVWVLIIESVAVTIAMYCLIQFYIQISKDIAQYRPFLKILCIKLVIFLSFWQSTVIDFLTSSGIIKSSDKVVLQDWNNALPNLLICIEMSLFAILHFWGFSWGPYVLKSTVGDKQQPQQQPINPDNDAVRRYRGGFLGCKALFDACNPWDLVKATARGFRWLFVGRKSRTLDPSYEMANTTDSPDTKLSGTGTGVDESLLETGYQPQGTEYLPEAIHTTENMVYIPDRQSAHQNTGYTPQNTEYATHTQYDPHNTRY